MSFAHYNISTADITTISAVDSVADSLAVQGSPKYITLCNKDASGDACVVDLYIVSQLGTDITDTGTNANETDNYTTESSVTLTVDGTAATDDVFKNQQVWKSDGTLFGTCTARNSNTEIVFTRGIEQNLVDNADLYTGSRYYILHDVSIPKGTTLLLEGPELNYDSTTYALAFKLTSVSASQLVDIKVTY